MRIQRISWAAAGILLGGTLLAPVCGDVNPSAAYVYTATARADPDAWATGEERFPEGAAIRVVSSGESRELLPGWFASADPEVSFDGQTLLFAGKQRREDRWQIWEAPVVGRAPRRVTNFAEDCIRPLYLPDGKVVYARKTERGYQLEALASGSVHPLRLTYAPGNFLPSDVLQDGRVLYESDDHELYTVYPDGSGVEAYRCDHGTRRREARQVTSGDVVFATAQGLARFTSALATQVDVVPAHGGEFAGGIAEIAADEWLAPFRPNGTRAYAIYCVNPSSGTMRQVTAAPGIEPVLLATRQVPRRFPSALHDRDGGNLLCLNAYTSKHGITEGSIARVRLYSEAASKAMLLGETAVESDGSFFLHVPADQPLRLELMDRLGRAIVAEHGWWWMRRGEQRVCVGCHAGPERAPENTVPKVLLRADVPVKIPAGGGQ